MEFNINIRKPDGYWTYEKCAEEALKYFTKKEWAENENSAHNAARNNGWFEECCAHMERLTNIPYTKEECLKSALKYETTTDWARKGKGAYSASKRNGWFDECTKHMNKNKNVVFN